jgi:lipopolysaccharide export system protein LptA
VARVGGILGDLRAQLGGFGALAVLAVLGLAQARAEAADPAPAPRRSSVVDAPLRSASAPNVEADLLSLQADQLELDAGAHAAVLTGKVRVARGGLVLHAPRVEVGYEDGDGASPRVTWAKASGGVVAEVRGIRAEAPEVEVDLVKHILELRGGVRVTRGGGWLTADRASIHTETLKVSMSEVKGSLPIGAIGASSKSSR